MEKSNSEEVGPAWAAHEELKELNKKFDWLLEKTDLMLSELRMIQRKTVAPTPGTGSSYKRP